MATEKLGLPTITGNMTADVVRDLNALADGVDAKAGTAGGLATLGADGKLIPEQTPTIADASTTQKGLVQLNDTTNSTSTTQAATPSSVKTVNDALESHKADTTAHIAYAVDNSGTDSYAITVSGITAYTPGMIVNFIASTANASGCTLNINNLGVIGIYKYGSSGSTSLETGDILANQPVSVIYDGVHFILLSIPANVTTGQSSQTLSNKMLIAPKFLTSGFIADDIGNEQLKFYKTPNAVNNIAIQNSIMGAAPQIKADGDDTNIDLNLVPKGTGKVTANGSPVMTNSLLSVAGDIIYASAANTPARLAKGTDGQALVLSGGLPTWGSAGAKVATGSYVGNGDSNLHTIAIGFTPSYVFVKDENYGVTFFSIGSNDISIKNSGVVVNENNVSIASNGFNYQSGSNGSSVYGANVNGNNYSWFAIG